MKQKTKAILVDVLGFTLILAAIPLGWLPGPGGIPLIILGLSLLATNHEWAERWLTRVKVEAGKAADKVANTDPTTKWAIDLFSIALIAAAVVLVTHVTRSIATTVAISLTIVGLTMLLTNQNRYKKAWNKFKRKHKH